MNRLALMVIKNFWKVPSAYIKLCHYAKHTDKYSAEVKYKHIQYILKTAVKSGNINLKVYGVENIPKEDGYLIYANHQGLFDIIAIAVTHDKPWAAVLKKELYKIPLLKQMVDCTKSYPMDREDVRQSMKVIQTVTKEVENGRNILIFPEGTRSKKKNTLLEFHGGSFKCATKSKRPILPVALIDCYKVLDQKGSKKVNVEIHYLKPITYEEYKDMNTMERANMVRKKIAQVVY
ncbi:MAG: lysophospholipid acyltransferase family protein [Lachnospiraceae bacterium]|nr:lysophospholipid acyltransferase family protein [Lachnospiraceae bacterium]